MWYVELIDLRPRRKSRSDRQFSRSNFTSRAMLMRAGGGPPFERRPPPPDLPPRFPDEEERHVFGERSAEAQKAEALAEAEAANPLHNLNMCGSSGRPFVKGANKLLPANPGLQLGFRNMYCRGLAADAADL